MNYQIKIEEQRKSIRIILEKSKNNENQYRLSKKNSRTQKIPTFLTINL